MAENSIAFDILDKRWRTASNILFGEDVGGLEGFKPWLLKYTEPMMRHKSSVSGKDVTYAITEYADDSKWIGYDEVDFQKKGAPLSINEIKDIDSLADALRQRAYYAGNAVLGNSKFVEHSSNITDSFYMFETGKYTDSKYMAYSTFGRLCEDCYGCNGIGESQLCVKSYETHKDKRCFELWVGQNCSDAYYSHNIASCQDVMFCFNAKNLRNAIGNLQLAKQEYVELKKKLLHEMADELKRKRSLPSLVEIVGKCQKPKILQRGSQPDKKPEETGKAGIEDAFSKTCLVVLGKKLGSKIDEYEKWLKENTKKNQILKSIVSGTDVHCWDYCGYFMLPKDRMLTPDEAKEIGQAVKIEKNEAMEFSLANAHEKIGEIALFTSEYKDGTNINLIECATSTDSANCYRSSPIVYSKYCAYSFWPRSSEYAFGCAALLSSQFCLKCHNSVKLQRCFEVDFSRDCSDCYFCHNCEGCTECLFCFNAKSKRYAIGNVEMPKEEYMKVKKMVLGEIVSRLEKEKKLELSIYNLGVKK